MSTESKPVLPQPFVGEKGAKAPDVPIGKVTIYNVATGEPWTTKPINATEAVAGGYWSKEPPAPKSVVREAPVAAPSTEEGRATREKELKGLSADEVKAIAAKADLDYTNKGDAIEAILDVEFPA